MANQITDNRVVMHLADTASVYTDLTGSAAGTLDTEIFIEGSGSIGQYLTSTLSGLLLNLGSPANLSNNVFYVWINCGIVGLLATKASGGFRIRFCGASPSNFFEFYVGGSDSWPTAIEGGWAMFVVDIEATPSNTGGTPPATSAIQYFGWAGVTAGTMPRMADNTWMDASWRLPDGSPGIIVEGRNGGTTDWNSADIASQLGNAAGMFIPGPGGSYVLRAPIQFGAADTAVHGFADTNKIWLWDDQEFAPSDLYRLSALGLSAGTTNLNLGIKTGSGQNATGAQGLTIAAAAGGVRWDMDFNDPNLDSVGLYGCLFQHGGNFALDSAAVDVASTLYLDCTSALMSNSQQVRISVVNANTADGVAFISTDTPNTIAHSTHEFSDGHALEITSAAGSPFTYTGNTHSGYGADGTTDAAILIDALTATLNVDGGGDAPTKREISGGSLTVNADTPFTFFPKDANQAPPTSYEWRVYTVTAKGSLSGAVEIAGAESSSAASQTVQHQYTSQDVAVQIISDDFIESITYYTLTTAALTVDINLTEDVND